MKIKSILLSCLLSMYSYQVSAVASTGVVIATQAAILSSTVAGSLLMAKNKNKESEEESMERSEPKKGEIYKHFKGEYYRIISIGHHSETKERMVVYEKISKYGYEVSGEIVVVADEPCIRPLQMFMSEVDNNKYPDVKQQYRFERVK